MIISHWKGFEIDSSEGYYGFTSEVTDDEERWKCLNKILTSPLLWDTMAFEIQGNEKASEGEIYSYLSGLEKKRKIINIEKENKFDYCPYVYAASPLILQIILDRFKEKIGSVWINFCIRPLKSIEGDEYSRLKTWFIDNFTKKSEGKTKWSNYKAVNEKDLTLGGNQDYTDSWALYFAFEASLRFDTGDEKGLSIFMCAGDPSFIIYLISTVFLGYNLEFYGDHYVSIDRRPDKLHDLLD